MTTSPRHLLLPQERIAVGANEAAPFLAFGDDSQYKGFLTFAYVVIPKTKVRRVMRAIDRIKAQFRFPADVPIHCRVLFSGHQRERHGLGHLNKDAPIRLLHHVVTLVNDYDLFIRYAFARQEAWKGVWGGKDVTELRSDDGVSEMHPVATDPKGILGLLAQACWAVSDPNGPHAMDCEMYASKDPTPTKFIGREKRQAHNWIQGLSAIHAPEGKWFDICPKFDPGHYAPLLELADVAAYLYCHALHGRKEEPEFADLAARVRYWSRSEFHLGESHGTLVRHPDSG